MDSYVKDSARQANERETEGSLGTPWGLVASRNYYYYYYYLY